MERSGYVIGPPKKLNKGLVAVKASVCLLYVHALACIVDEICMATINDAAVVGFIWQLTWCGTRGPACSSAEALGCRLSVVTCTATLLGKMD